MTCQNWLMPKRKSANRKPFYCLKRQSDFDEIIENYLLAMERNKTPQGKSAESILPDLINILPVSMIIPPPLILRIPPHFKRRDNTGYIQDTY